MKLVSLALLTVVVGCAKKDGTLTQSEAMSAGQALGSEIESGAGGFGPVADQGAGVDAACITLSGDTADPDGDKIPNAATLTFNCTSTVLGVTTTVTGTESITDGQPNALAWAFSANANLHGTVVAGQASATTDRNGTITATQDSAVGPFKLDRTLVVTTVLADARNSVTVDVNNAWTITYTPQAAWTPGGLVVTGTLAATGSWDVSVGAHSAMATLATPAPLTLDPGCATRVTAGTVTGTYDGGGHSNTITVTWTGCGASTVTYSAR